MTQARIRAMLERLNVAIRAVSDNRPGYVRDTFSSIEILAGADMSPKELDWYQSVVQICKEQPAITQDVVDTAINLDAMKAEALSIATHEPGYNESECPDGFLVMGMYDLLLMTPWMSESTRAQAVSTVDEILVVMQTTPTCFQDAFWVARSILNHAPDQTDTQKVARGMLMRLLAVG